MKRVVSVFLATVLAACASINVFAAGINVSTKSTEEKIVATYSEDKFSKDITSLMNESKNLTDSKDVIEQITIESESEKPVVALLKLEIPEDVAKNSGYSAIDYIDFRISSSDGTILFEETEARASSMNNRTLILGTLNNESENDTQIFNIRMSSNDKIKYSDLENSVSDIKWSLEVNADIDSAMNSVTNNEVSPSPQPTQKVLTITVGDKTDKEGNMLEKGVYVLFGNGACNIKSKDGSKNITFTLNPEEAKGKTVALEVGDTVVVTGDSNAKIQFGTPATASTTATPKPAKANPKTGDSTPIVAITVLAFIALSGILYGTFSKRKED